MTLGTVGVVVGVVSVGGGVVVEAPEVAAVVSPDVSGCGHWIVLPDSSAQVLLSPPLSEHAPWTPPEWLHFPSWH